MTMQQGTWQDPESSWYRQPVAEDAPWWAKLAGSDPLMSIPGAQTLRGAGQQFMGEGAGRALTGLRRMFMPGAMASQNIRQGDYGAAGVDMGLDMLPLGGLAARGLRGGRNLVGRVMPGTDLGESVGRGIDFPNIATYGPRDRTFNPLMQFTNPYSLPSSRDPIGRFVVGAQPQARPGVPRGDTRMFITDASGMNFRPAEYLNRAGGPMREMAREGGQALRQGDQEFMDMLNARYTYPSGQLPQMGPAVPPHWAQRIDPDMARRATTAATATPTTPAAMNRMIGMYNPSGTRTPVQSEGMSKVGQFNIGGGLATAPAAARTARDMREPEGEGRIFPSPSQRPRRSDPRPRQRRRNVVTND